MRGVREVRGEGEGGGGARREVEYFFSRPLHTLNSKQSIA